MKKILLFLSILYLSSFVYAQDPWIIKADKIDPNNYYGITVANGMIGVVSSPEPLKVKEVILAGVYDRYERGRTSNFLPSFNLLDMKLHIGWEEVNASSISNFTQQLNMQTGEFSASFDYKDLASVTYRYYALRHLPHSVLMDITVMPKRDTYLVAENILKTPASLRDNQLYYNEINPAHGYIPLLTSTAKSPSGNITMVASNSFLFTEKGEEIPRISHEMRDSDSHLAKFTKKLNAGEEYSFSLIGTLISSVQNDDAYNQAERLSIFAALEGRERLLDRHNKAWSELWKSDIEIEGDAQAQQDVRSMLYHLYSFGRENTDYSPSPMGLSGLGYNGHVFWDTEVFMFPPMLILQPEIAKSMLEYRYRRLEAAKRNAATNGYRGAMFPWESAASGTEECPVWALSGPFEHHITADVANAAWNYYLVTQDKEWLKEKGWAIISSAAEFWESRVELNSNGIYEIKNVVAADEWAENVDNNAFTNAAVKVCLRNATECAKVLGVTVPKQWNVIADKIPISKMPNGVTREHDTYDGQPIKQADVNLLAYPLAVVTETSQIRKDLGYYTKKVPEKETPAMTQAIFSLLYSRLGDADEAHHWFNDAYVPNLLPPFRVMAETKGGTNPYFATGAGGVLQSVIMGFGGVDINPKGGIRQLKTAMPSHWSKLTIKGVGAKKDTIVITNKK